MKVSFKSEGGFGFFPGLTKPVEIDSNELPAEEADHLEKLVDQAAFFDQKQPKFSSKQKRDIKSYTISIESHGRRHEVNLSDTSLQPELQDLVSYLRKKQREIRGK